MLRPLAEARPWKQAQGAWSRRSCRTRKSADWFGQDAYPLTWHLTEGALKTKLIFQVHSHKRCLSERKGSFICGQFEKGKLGGSLDFIRRQGTQNLGNALCPLRKQHILTRAQILGLLNLKVWSFKWSQVFLGISFAGVHAYLPLVSRAARNRSSKFPTFWICLSTERYGLVSKYGGPKLNASQISFGFLSKASPNRCARSPPLLSSKESNGCQESRRSGWRANDPTRVSHSQGTNPIGCQPDVN